MKFLIIFFSILYCVTTQGNEKEGCFFKTLMYRERIWSGRVLWVTAEARPRDTVLVTLERDGERSVAGSIIKPYNIFYQSVNRFLQCGTFQSPKLCRSYPNCFIYFQDWIDREKWGLIIEDVTSLFVGLRIKGQLYNLGEVVEQEREKITTAFRVTEDMMEESVDFTSLYFVVRQKEDKREFRRGAIRFVDRSFCPSEKNIIFNNQTSPIVSNRKYRVTIVLKSKRDLERENF